jgi:hypothetical protein
MLRDSLSYGYYQSDLSLYSFHDGLLATQGWNEYDSGVAIGLSFGLETILEDRNPQMHTPKILGIDSTDNLGSIIKGGLGMEGSLFTSQSLDQYLGFLIDEGPPYNS